MSRTRHHGDNAKMRLFGEDWRWLENEPRWFRKMYKHRPQRRKSKLCSHKVMRGDEPVWPLNKKPMEYYW